MLKSPRARFSLCVVNETRDVESRLIRFILLRIVYTYIFYLRRKLCVNFHLYFCVVFRVDVQYTCGPLVYSVHGHVAGVTRSTTANAEEEAARRSRDGGK